MKTKKNNVRQNRNLSVNMLSLTPHSEMNSTTTHGISELINELKVKHIDTKIAINRK